MTEPGPTFPQSGGQLGFTSPGGERVEPDITTAVFVTLYTYDKGIQTRPVSLLALTRASTWLSAGQSGCPIDPANAYHL